MQNKLSFAETAGNDNRALGDRLARLRTERGLTLQQLSDLVDIPVSTLSKVQNHQATLTYGSLMKLSRGLGINISELFEDDVPAGSKAGRRIITRREQGSFNEVDTYDVEVLAADLLSKSMHPGVLVVLPEGEGDAERLSRHPGEEFAFVLEGRVRIHSEDYKPVELEEGDSAYLDSASGHRYVSATDRPARILVICSHNVSETVEQEGNN
jgi:transcriptional regulator with XRE-family HTH domain